MMKTQLLRVSFRYHIDRPTDHGLGIEGPIDAVRIEIGHDFELQ
jgi:hypothetical protein